MYMKFEIGDLVSYNRQAVDYVPHLDSGIGIVLQVGAVDVRVHSTSQGKSILVRGNDLRLLSGAAEGLKKQRGEDE